MMSRSAAARGQKFKGAFMADFTVLHSEMREGVWQGVLSGPEGGDAPAIQVQCLDRVLGNVELTDQGKGSWTLRFPIPADLLSDGVQVLLVTDMSSGARLANYPIVSGQALEDDFRAELALLRAEVELLKKVLRNHCAEG